MNRRQWLLGAGTLLGAAAAPTAANSSRAGIQNPSPATANDKQLPLAEYEPKSMLQARETHIERPRYPAIDFHTHISVSENSENGVALSPERRYLGTPQELLAVMDRKGLRAMVNLTGGYDRGLVDAVTKYDRAFPGRFYSFTEPCYARFKEPDYSKVQADAIQQAYHDGAKGLKILKTLGLYLRENITSGTLVKIDDRRFDPMWDACGQLNLPVAIHVSDPIAFFLPTDRFNERYEELSNHPDWSFYDHDFPSNAELLEARNRVMARHPKTQFVVLHVGNFAENLENVSENLNRFPICQLISQPGLANSAASRAPPAGSSISIRTGSCSARTLLLTEISFPSRYLAMPCTRSTTASSRATMSTSITRRRRFRRRAAGKFTELSWAIPF
jgi:Amidohydrolase